MKKMETDSELLEKFVSREDIFAGRIVHLVRDTVLLPNGNATTREVMLHLGAVVIVPLFEDGTVLVERQFRYAQGRVMLEVPAGKLDSDSEDPLEAAKRELREETGLTAERWTDLGGFVPSPAVLGERLGVFLAQGLREGKSDLDPDEFLHLERRPLSELIDEILRGEIEDGKTVSALLRVYLLKERGLI